MFGLNLGATSSSVSIAPPPAPAYDFQNALEFDGVNDYMDGGSFSAVGSATEFTISVWLNPLVNSENGQFWVFENYNVRDYWFFYPSATYFRLNGSGNQNVWSYGYDSAGHTGSWTHYVLTRDSSNVIEMYVNGTKQTKSTSNANSNNIQFRYFGRRGNGTKHFKGQMDEFIVANGYCATQQDVTDLYNNGLGVDSSTILTSPRHYWLFNETTGTTATDSGSQGNNLTLNNFTGDYWVSHDFEFENALLFDGVNDYGSLTTGIATSGDITLSCWFKYTGGDMGNIYGNSGSASMSIRVTSSTQVRWYDGSNNNWTVPSMSIGNWYHLFITKDGTVGRCYLNGVESTNTVTLNGTMPTVDQIGRYYNGTLVPLDGQLDDVAIKTGYVATLSNAQDIYNSGYGESPEDVMGALNVWYKFNETTGTTASDSSGNGNDLTLNNFTGTYWVSHYFANALLFDGINDYVNFTEQTYTSTVFSASFWIKYAAVNSNRIIFGSDSNSNKYFRLDSATQFSFRTRSAGASIDTWTVPTLSSGQWYHIAISLDNGTNLLWLNGTQYSSNSSVNYAAETISIGRIGGRSDGTQMTEGAIDDFIIESLVLTQTNVDSIYNSGAGSLPTTAFPSSDVYYKFDEASGTSAADSSGNSNTGTLNNFAGTYFIPHS